MFKEERFDKILEILNEENYVSADKLAKILYVSLPTIRRDLSALDKQGLIIRSHGGAKKIGLEKTVMPVEFRKTQNFKDKRALCERAVKFIEDESIIFIDASTTTMQMTDFISPSSRITVITNSIIVSSVLTKKGIKTYLTGGELQQNSMCYAGAFAESFVRQFNYSAVFFSCHGVDKKGNIVDTSLTETNLRKVLIAQTKKSVFLCDKTKFLVSAPFNLAKLSEIDVVITNDKNLKLKSAIKV